LIGLDGAKDFPQTDATTKDQQQTQRTDAERSCENFPHEASTQNGYLQNLNVVREKY